eukprot:75313_1
MSTLTKSGFFRGLLSDNFADATDEEGYYFVDRDGKMFEYLLNYMRCGYVSVPVKYMPIVIREADFYQISLNVEKFMERMKLPNLVLRNCYVNDERFDDVYKSYGITEKTKKEYRNDPIKFAAYLTQHFGYEITVRSAHWGKRYYNSELMQVENLLVLKPVIPENITLMNDSSVVELKK